MKSEENNKEKFENLLTYIQDCIKANVYRDSGVTPGILRLIELWNWNAMINPDMCDNYVAWPHEYRNPTLIDNPFGKGPLSFKKFQEIMKTFIDMDGAASKLGMLKLAEKWNALSMINQDQCIDIVVWDKKEGSTLERVISSNYDWESVYVNNNLDPSILYTVESGEVKQIETTEIIDDKKKKKIVKFNADDRSHHRSTIDVLIFLSSKNGEDVLEKKKEETSDQKTDKSPFTGIRINIIKGKIVKSIDENSGTLISEINKDIKEEGYIEESGLFKTDHGLEYYHLSDKVLDQINIHDRVDIKEYNKFLEGLK